MSQPLIQSDNKQGYLVVIEKGDTSYGAYVPDLPGCVAVGESKLEVETLIAESIEIYLEVLREKAYRFLSRQHNPIRNCSTTLTHLK